MVSKKTTISQIVLKENFRLSKLQQSKNVYTVQ